MTCISNPSVAQSNSGQKSPPTTQRAGIFSLPPKVPPIKQTSSIKRYSEEIRMTGGTQSRRRAILYADAWTKSRAPKPNYAVTISLPSVFRDEAIAAGLSAPQAIQRWLFAPVRTGLIRLKLPFLWIGVLEIESGDYHVHGLVYMPSDECFLRAFLPAWKKLVHEDQRTLDAFRQYFKLDWSGTPIHAHRISEYRQYSATGGVGVKGWLDYMTKVLDQTVASKRRKWPADRAISISRPVTRLVAKKSFGRHTLRYNLK